MALSRRSVNWLVSCWTSTKRSNRGRQVQEFLGEQEGAQGLGPGGLFLEDAG